ncbi:MAG TPA: ABC transporter permease [Gaiellaceae bacterium]|nr:ABC transporter permease [Gaiellaceae bacterium]
MSDRLSNQPPHVDTPPPSVAVRGEPQIAVQPEAAQPDAAMDLAYESGVELKARSQWGYAARRFVRHRLAMGSLVILIALGFVAIFADKVAPYEFDALDFENLRIPPTTEGKHYFGTDLLGRDSLSRVVYGLRTSLWVALVVALLATIIGTAVGAISGYFGGVVDNVLMRLTDLVLTLPGLAVLLTISVYMGQGDPLRVAIILALLFWTGFARIVRGTFLSLREKEFVEAAKASGAGDFRIITRHMLPNAVGPIIVNATLIVAAAILTEAGLSFLGFGVQPPNPALGVLINEGQGEGLKFWWLVTFPGLTIVLIALCINFIGDGLRDALDPTQRRLRA